MRISKWVDMGAEVDVEISASDIGSALSEAFSNATRDDPLREEPSVHDVLRAFNYIGGFLNGFTNDHIALLNPAQRRVIAKFLSDNAARFAAEEVVGA